MKKLTKLLSRNDVAETSSHQAGILIPKYGEFLSFFPYLNPHRLNPDTLLEFRDKAGNVWEFRFIYYNNAKFGGTRNEYRLTRMTRFLKNNNARSGDGIILTCDDNGHYYTKIIKDPSIVEQQGKAEYHEKPDREIEYDKEYDLIFDKHWTLTEWEVNNDGNSRMSA